MMFIEVFNAFREIEDERMLFKKKIQDIYFWDILRFPLFEAIAKKKNIYPNRPKSISKENKFKHIASMVLRLASLFPHNPFFKTRKDFLFFGPGMSRQRVGSDGKTWDIYCDPLIDFIGPEYCVLLEGYDIPFSSVRGCHAKHMAYTNVFSIIDKMMKLTGVGAVSLCYQDRIYLQDLENHIKKVLDVEIDLLSTVEMQLANHRRMVSIHKKYLTCKNPNVIFLVCSYGKEALIDASQQLSIPTIEIQHGAISPLHLAYSYPKCGAKHLFPDYFLCMGRYWEQTTDLPINHEYIITIGSPAAENELTPVSPARKEKKITFISQWTIGKQLSRFAAELSLELSNEYKIVYKLHPGETIDWQLEYPWLIDSDVLVVEGHQASLYDLLAESEFQIGVYSTAIFEGMYAGCKTFLVDLPGVEHMKPLVDKGLVKLVSNPRDLNLNSDFHLTYDNDYFFSHNWRQSFNQFLESKGRFC